MITEPAEKTCTHDALRFPRRIERTPGAIIRCPDCHQSWRRPAWMDRFEKDEIRAIQALAEILAVWIDYHDPDPDAEPEDLVYYRKAFQRIAALTQTNLRGQEHRLEDILQRLGEYVH